MSGRGGVVCVDMDGVTQRHANLAPAGVANLLQPVTYGEIKLKLWGNLDFDHFTSVFGLQNVCKMHVNMVLNGTKCVKYTENWTEHCFPLMGDGRASGQV